MYCDDKLEDSSQWHAGMGPDIGDALPDSFTILPPDPSCEWMKVTIDGHLPYAGALAGLRRPYLPTNVGLVSTELDMMFDDAALAVCQAAEVTCRICTDDGYNNNGSWQINNQKGGMIQIYGVPPNPAWVDTGIVIGKIIPWHVYHVKVNYSLDTVRHTFSNYSFEIDGKVYLVPTPLQNIPAELLHWTQGLYWQLQIDLASKGGKFSAYYRRIRSLWP